MDKLPWGNERKLKDPRDEDVHFTGAPEAWKSAKKHAIRSTKSSRLAGVEARASIPHKDLFELLLVVIVSHHYQINVLGEIPSSDLRGVST